MRFKHKIACAIWLVGLASAAIALFCAPIREPFGARFSLQVLFPLGFSFMALAGFLLKDYEDDG